VPVTSERTAEEFALIGRLVAAVNDHYVSVKSAQYVIACPRSKGFVSRSVSLKGTRDERTAVLILSCPQCGDDVAIPDHERSLYAAGQQLKTPAWKTRATAVGA
jgi:hypothetical protein